MQLSIQYMCMYFKIYSWWLHSSVFFQEVKLSTNRDTTGKILVSQSFPSSDLISHNNS